jgi:hypothetical protein
MARRLEFQALLITLLGSDHVYFQPPASLQLKYPCIVYSRDTIDIRHADNSPYKHKTRYQLTVIDLDPDSEIVEKVKELPMCSYSRFFTADDLNHDVFEIFF